MAKMLKQLVFGPKKNPPAPPRPDYEGNKVPVGSFDNQTEVPFYGPDYENVPKFKCKGKSTVQFAESKEAELLVFDDYSEPADLRAEILSTLEADPLYVSPLDVRGATAPPLEDEEDMYCLPYDEGRPPDDHRAAAEEEEPPKEREEDSTYDVVPDDEHGDEEGRKEGGDGGTEYDEPWEWSVGARLTNSLQVSPAASLEDLTSEDEDAMTARQQRRLLYETAFDSRVKRDPDDLDRLMQQQSPPLFLKPQSSVARAASRSSFGSTSGSSASSTPTHQPMDVIVSRHSSSPAHHHFTPTERRKVSLVRDGLLPRSVSPPQARNSCPRSVVPNQNFERKISFSSSQWDNVSRCSDRSSSQESMNVDVASSGRNFPIGRSASRDSLSDRRCNNLTSSSSNRKELLTSCAKLENTNDLGKVVRDSDVPKSVRSAKKTLVGQSEVKVLPADCVETSSSKSGDLTIHDPELKENNSQLLPVGDATPHHQPVRKSSRSSSLLSEVRPMDNLPQSPENDDRTSEDYDPPWDLKIGGHPVLRPSGGVNGSVSVPERLSSSGGNQSSHHLPTSVTHDKLDGAQDGNKATAASKLNRPGGGISSRPNLNLNLNSDSPRKGRQNLMLNFGCSALSAVGEKVDPQLTLEKQGWYHGSISRVDAESKLRVLKEGSYLVRNSESSKQDYSLSLKSARGFMHMKIVPTSEGRFILGQFSNPFASIPEMIQHYSLNKLPIKGAEHMSLLYPVIDQLL